MVPVQPMVNLGSFMALGLEHYWDAISEFLEKVGKRIIEDSVVEELGKDPGSPFESWKIGSKDE